MATWTPVEAALTLALIDYHLAINEMDRETRAAHKIQTEPPWIFPDQSHINTKALKTIQALCSGELDPDEYMDEWGKRDR